MDKRTLLAELFDVTGATGLMLTIKRRSRSPWLPVVTFHRVVHRPPRYRFDDEVLDTTPAEFEEQVRSIRDHFTPVSIQDVHAFLEGEELPSNPVLVTVDDGYRDNYEVALPILRRHGVKAAFFIATDFVTRRRVFWWDQIAYLIKTTARTRIELTYPRVVALDLDTPAKKAVAIKRLLRLVKKVYGLDLPRFLDALVAATGVVWTDELERTFANELLMTWDQVRALRAAGMDVQSHTRTHRVLQTLSPADVLNELRDSRAELEQQLDAPVEAISYPVGHTINDRPDVRESLLEAGYKMGFTNATGTQSTIGQIDRFNIRRLAMAPHIRQSLFRAILTAPQVFDQAF